MFKKLIDQQREELEKQRLSVSPKINEIDSKIDDLIKEKDTLIEQFNKSQISNKSFFISALESRIKNEINVLEQEKLNYSKNDELKNQFKQTLENNLDEKIVEVETVIEQKGKNANKLTEKIREVIMVGDLTSISGLTSEFDKVLFSKKELDELLGNLKNIKNSFNKDTYEKIVERMKQIEDVDLESDEEEIDEFIGPDSYDDILMLYNSIGSELYELLNADVDAKIMINSDIKEETIKEYYSMAEGFIKYNSSDPRCNDIARQLETIKSRYDEYIELKKLINEIIGDINDLKTNNNFNMLNIDINNIKLRLHNIDIKYFSVKKYLVKMLDDIEKQLETSHKLDTQVNPDESLDNDDDKVKIESMINELKNNISNFSKQVFVDTARQILSKIELLEDKELKEDLTKQLKLIEFSSTNNESNDNLNLDELKKKFREEYSLIEKAMLTDDVIDFGKIYSLAYQIKDKSSQTNPYASIDNLKDLYELSSKVSIKIKNDEITPDDEKEITNLLHEIRKISKVVYEGMNKRFIKRKEELTKDPKEEKVIFFKKRTSTSPIAAENTENSQGTLPAGKSDDYEDIFTNLENNSRENERKIFGELKNKINHTTFDKLEDLRNEVESVKKSKGINEEEAIKLNLLIGNIKDQLEKIDATSEALIKNIGLISLEKFADKNEVQGMLDNFNKYVDSIKAIYERVKSNPTDSTVAKEYDKLVDTFVEFNNKVSTKFNIEKYRIKPKSKMSDFKYNGNKLKNGNIIARLSKERLQEEGYKKLFANTEKILEAKDIISELQVKIRFDGLKGLKGRKLRKYNKAINDICEDLFKILNDEIKELERDNFTLIPTSAFDSWILMLSIMPDSIKVKQENYTRGYVTELVAKYASMINGVIEKSNDESVKKQLNQHNDFDLDACYSTIAAICLYRKEHDYFDFIDNSQKEDFETLYADHYSVLQGIRYIDPVSKVKSYIDEVGTTYRHKPI